MLSSSSERVVVFLITGILLILSFIVFIILIIYKYQQKQNIYYQKLEELKATHENDMLISKIEIQEQTFANISREIHDNIGQKLTLAKLHLNTLNLSDPFVTSAQVNNSVAMIGEAIKDLSDISRSMSSEIILSNGFIKALEFEVNQLNKTGLFSINLSVTGEAVFLESNTELILFRITQEALNNIVKHANATRISIELHYEQEKLTLMISDNGKGFLMEQNFKGNGIFNMTKRASMLNGSCEIYSQEFEGTKINIQIPFHENKQKI